MCDGQLNKIQPGKYVLPKKRIELHQHDGIMRRAREIVYSSFTTKGLRGQQVKIKHANGRHRLVELS